MTKLLDRITNQQVDFQDLTGPIVPGRYLLINEASINSQPELLSAGSLLCGDGTGIIHIGKHSVACLDQLKDKEETRFQLTLQSIRQIRKFTNPQEKKLQSPLLPSSLLSDEGQLNELETLLKEVLTKGHLHEISRRPRMDMRYEEQVQVVSRAKRLAPSSHRHLAAHSECWQRRTFTGIQPKRILSLVSQDEYNLYENRVFSRLLDRLERFLLMRLREINELQQTISNALDLEGSQELNYRLREKLFAIWGETFTTDDTLQAAELLEQTQTELEQQLKTIKGLMHTGIYTQVPRNAQVPARLEPTNILTHDAHYRHLLPLWNTLTKVSRGFDLTPQEKLAKQNMLQDDYIFYCGLLIDRALRELGFTKSEHNGETVFEKGKHQLFLSKTHSTWEIRDDNFNKTIALCPIATWHPGSLESVTKSDHILIPCTLNNDAALDHPSQWLDGTHNGAMQLSPLDFYVEEGLISLLNAWMVLNNVGAYGEKLTKLPISILTLASKINEIDVDDANHTIQLLQPLPQEITEQLTRALCKSNAQQAKERFSMQAQVLNELSKCPVCRSKSGFIPRGDRSFKAECTNSSCKLTWSINGKDRERYILLTTNDPTVDSFKTSGRWYQKSLLSQE